MAKLYPPHIEGKLPAFTGTSLRIPLTMNKTVSSLQTDSIQLIIKTVQTGAIKGSLSGILTYNANKFGEAFASFDVSGIDLTVGQYYKIQIAYIEKGTNEIGYYSNVGIIKYTAMPDVYIKGLSDNTYNKNEYVGIYSQAGEGKDTTEKIYSYCFEITDSDNNIIATSGGQLHDSSKDISLTETQDTWYNNLELEKDKQYHITYKITTMNGLEVSSQAYILEEQDTVNANLQAILTAQLSFDDGCISLYLEPIIKTSNREDIVITGSFRLSRASSETNFKYWEKIQNFSYENMNLSDAKKVLLWEDYSIQQGVEYLYALQMYNKKNLYSTKMYNVNDQYEQIPQKIMADFEDAFLTDGERQLKIRFNPKISSFKNTILESKVDTIGGQYPFIFRNGKIKYKEFAISGLISMLSDTSEKFLKGIQSSNNFPNRISTPSFENPPTNSDTSLTSNNIFRERNFKMEVLEWLNNGKPKIFKSPTEGNFIVRLMNVSLTPNNTLGRMLHTFQCTAYEISDYNLTNLIDLNLITMPELKTTAIKVGQIEIKQALNNLNQYPNFTGDNSSDKQILTVPDLLSAKIMDAIPGTQLSLTFKQSKSPISIEIGGTGIYTIPIEEENPLIRIQLITRDIGWGEAILHFSYESDDPKNAFDQIVDLTSNYEIRQIIGSNFNTNLIEGLSDIRREVGMFNYIKIAKRDICNVYLENNKYYRKEHGVDEVLPPYNPAVIYYEINKDKYWTQNQGYLNGEPDYRFAINTIIPEQNYIDFGGRKDTNPEDLWGDSHGRLDAFRDVEKVDNLYVGNGLIVDTVYKVKTKIFEVEETNPTVKKAKEDWENSTDSTYDKTYEKYIKALEKALKDAK